MKKLIVVAALTLMGSAAFAQSGTGPAPQSDNMNKPGMTNNMDKGSMNKETTGMNNDMSKGNPKKEMSKDGSPAAGTKDMKK